MAGGKERRFVELLRGLQLIPSLEFEIVLMDENIHYKEIFEMNSKIEYLIRSSKKDFSVFRKFYKICKGYKPDIVHCWDSMTAVYSIPACKLLGIKLVNGMVADTPVKQNILNKYWLRAKITFLFSNIIIGNSAAGLAAYNAPMKKSHLIYNGFNFERIKNLQKRETIRNELKIKTKYLIGMVASFSIYKDYKTYFDAAQFLLDKRNDVTFIAIGNNTDSIQSMSLIDNKYKEAIKLLGKTNKVESYIEAMDICVLATFTEGISNSILEYMALSKPVVATDGGGTSEIILNNKTGFLIEPNNPKVLAEKINILLDNYDLRKTFGENAGKRIKEKFSINTMVENSIDCYKECLHINNFSKIDSKQTKNKFFKLTKSES